MSSVLDKIMKKNPNIHTPKDVEYYTTGFKTLDEVLGKGYPKGRFLEMWGTPGCGKTTLALQNCVEVQKNDKSVVWFDSEHSYDPAYADSLGIDKDKLIYIEPTEGSHAKDLDSIVEIAREGLCGMIVVDSIARLDPPDVMDRTMEQHEQAALPKFLKRFLNKMMDILAEKQITLLMINQITADMSKSWNAETTPGGNAPKFQSYARVRLCHTQYIDDRGQPVSGMSLADKGVGDLVKVSVKKTRGGRPHLETILKMEWGKGFSKQYDNIQNLLKTGKIVQAGAWYQYEGKKFQGLDKVIKHVEAIEAVNRLKEAK